jgi:hypothetical protein
VRLLVVWMPMVPGDDRDAAVALAGTLSDARATHLWDPERRIGLNWTRQFGRSHVDELARALEGEPQAEWLLEELRADEPSVPVWDCAFFFRPGARWVEPLPTPDGWMKQFAYWSDADGSDEGGAYWTDRAPSELLESSWPAEFERGMADLRAGR